MAELIAGLLAGPSAPAAAADHPAPYVYEIGAAAAMPYLTCGREVATHAGFSRVRLWRGEQASWIAEPDSAANSCEAFGAGMWLGDEVEGQFLDFDAAPPDTFDPEGGVRNPTVSRSVNPSRDPRLHERRPSEPGVTDYFPPGQMLVPLPADGPAPQWKADATLKAREDKLGGHEGLRLGVAWFERDTNGHSQSARARQSGGASSHSKVTGCGAWPARRR